MPRPRKKDRHLPQCVYERHGAYWYVKRGKWTRLGATLNEALGAYAAIVAEPSEGVPALIDKVLARIKPSLAKSTVDQYEAVARHLRRRLAEFTPAEVRQRHVAAVMTDMASTPNMANRALSVLRLVYTYAVEWQLVDDNPCIGIRRFDEEKRDRYITDPEYAAIYAQAGPRLQVIMDLLYLTGQRVTDVLNIRISDLTGDGIQFKPQKTQRKTAAKLVVQWTPDLKRTVARAKSLHGNVRALTLLHNRHGKPPDYKTVAEQWSAACSRAKVEDAQLRDLRAKSLTDAENQGLNATELAAHASASMTKRYIRRRQIPVVPGPSFGRPFDESEKES